ncbi:DNA-binding SARP family transcriptional activator [Streptomyces sp. 3330]|uniref:AfsR/SARP family transcriptional regulator n=1 Tax=Streptomyces sp. 3330 TaxID=2817755 RepID=UPI00285B5DC7|nr:BTAD domain-containing putative transcriptional regulator [Streptomyces sp. 3330]MDR6975029.1 DNA-binding SARP family transcriptional activator [Streptomyces sp. 3330]
MHDVMRFEVLGPVRVWREERELDPGFPQQRALLALLLAHAGRPVPTSGIVDVLWAERPPASALNVVRRYVGALRRLLEPGLPPRATGRRLLRRTGGYLLEAATEEVDLLRFRELTRQGKRAAATGRPETAARHLLLALGEWRGPLVMGIPASAREHVQFTAVQRELLETARLAADAALLSGHAEQALPALRKATAHDPLDESLHARLVLVLAACGLQAEALGAYEEVRRRLARELGLTPGPELAAAHTRVLRQDVGRRLRSGPVVHLDRPVDTTRTTTSAAAAPAPTLPAGAPVPARDPAPAPAPADPPGPAPLVAPGSDVPGSLAFGGPAVRKPGSGAPRTGESGRGASGGGESGRGESGRGESGRGESGGGGPGTGGPGGGGPGRGESGGGGPGSGAPRTGAPGTGGPGSAAPASGAPGAAILRTATPGAEAPGIEIPGTGIPGPDGSGVGTAASGRAARGAPPVGAVPSGDAVPVRTPAEAVAAQGAVLRLAPADAFAPGPASAETDESGAAAPGFPVPRLTDGSAPAPSPSSVAVPVPVDAGPDTTGHRAAAGPGSAAMVGGPGRTGGAPAGRDVVGFVRPAQLPSALPSFVGRVVESRWLERVAESTTGIVLVGGMPGIGKSTLALHWAHRAADRFPDGQLYVALRGSDPARPAVEPADALRGMLGALGVAGPRLPDGLDALTGMYRTLLAGRRVLVVLDDAVGTGQLSPLLPTGPGCLALVTSRHALPGLVASGASALRLAPPSAEDAYALLAARIGAERTAAEPRAAEEIVARCGRLPLALAAVAARAVSRRGFPLAALAAGLREAHGSLDALAATREAFLGSYRLLAPDTARLFRLLPRHEEPDITAAGAAALAGLPVRRARTLLGALADAHLLTEPAPGRYALHDLLRAFAAERAATDAGASDRAGEGRPRGS